MLNKLRNTGNVYVYLARALMFATLGFARTSRALRKSPPLKSVSRLRTDYTERRLRDPSFTNSVG